MVKIFSAEKCPYCIQLREGLDNLGISYEPINVEHENNAEIIKQVYEVANIEVIPIVAINNQLLVPGRSFKTIEEAIVIIQNLLDK